MTRKLLLFPTQRMDQILQKGNVWYLRHYERYFDAVAVAYLTGHCTASPVSQGNTRLISLGGRWENYYLDLLLAPWRLYRLAKQERATHFLTADIIYSWWTGLFIRLFLGAKVVLMPVAIPPSIYQSSGRSLSGWPIWLEKIMTWLCFLLAGRIITPVNGVFQRKWLESSYWSRRKLSIVGVTVEEFPAPEFFDTNGFAPEATNSKSVKTLLYVGRLHPEKLVSGLVDMMAELKKMQVPARLVLAGDGSEREKMESRAREMGVSEDMEFLGFQKAGDLIDVYRSADVYVSTLTGSSLREAGLKGLPIVAYDADWQKDLLKHEETAPFITCTPLG